MDFNLNLNLEQKLVMTQQMQLSVKLLQMSTIELQQYVDREIQENPVLESELPSDNTANIQNKYEYKELIRYFEFDDYSHNNYHQDEEEVSPFNFISSAKSLKEYLKEQITELDIPSMNKEICKFIIENIDERGYLDCSVESISEELKVSLPQVGEALRLVQELEPDGIGARDLKECLKIQLNKRHIEDKRLLQIIDNYLEYLADHKYGQLAKLLNTSAKQIQDYCDLIKSLEPKPSRGFFTGESTEYVVPDAFVKNIDGEYFIVMNEEALPRLRINSLYKNIIMNENDKKTVDYVKDKINSALFLINSIEKRKSTIHRILDKIVEIQGDYFEYGKNHLKPMTLKDIADALGVHESTVSRAIRDKYISTAFGIIKIKDFFTKGLSSPMVSGEVSSNSIKNKIEELILKEDKKNPLSDQTLCDILVKSGINIARRTVAKYREELGLLPSSKRKRI